MLWTEEKYIFMTTSESVAPTSDNRKYFAKTWMDPLCENTNTEQKPF